MAQLFQIQKYGLKHVTPQEGSGPELRRTTRFHIKIQKRRRHAPRAVAPSTLLPSSEQEPEALAAHSPLIERITRGSPYVFQQCSASPHTARKSQAWYVRNLQIVWTQYFVPLNSPDINPIDYFVWSVVGSKANEHRVASRDTPKHQITEVTESIDKEGVARACACFRTVLKKVIDAKGDHI